ncbi:MAG TPA: secretin N-terminal domain-containing protein [Lacunisphaera sp.]
MPDSIRSCLRSVLLLALWIPAAGPLQAQSSPPAPPPAAEATIGPIKFGDITIDAALEMLERWSGRTVLHPAGLPATSLSFSLNEKVTRAEAREALETLLTLNGIAVTPLGTRFLKVMPLNIARTEAPDFIEGSTLGLPPSGRIASKLYTLKFLRVAEFAPQISGLLNAGAASAPIIFEKTNALLLTDALSNLQRVETLLAQLDQPALEGLVPKFYKINNSTASALVTKLQSLLTGNTATALGSNTVYQADDRTNQIILLSDPRQHAFFDELIARLDTAGESSTRQEVIPLKHATATEVATLLSSLISGQTSANARTGGAQTTNQQLTAARNAALAAVNQANNLARQAAAQAQNNQANNANRPANAPAVPAPTPNIIFNPGNTGAPADSQQFSSILTVVADERSNALVVSGTVEDLRLIKDIVTQLDVLLAQVRIEVVIAEITLSDAASTGIEALGLTVQANKLVGFSGATPGLVVTNGTLVDATTGVRDLSATLALSTTPRKSNTNILSVPNIVTTHNKEANIFVGESRPVISSYQNTGVNTGNIGSGYTSNVNYREIGIRLTVKPLIGHDGSVQLEIKQEVNDILGDVLIDGNAQPIIGSRTTESFVSARSGEIVVLGGLQRKTQSRSTSRLAGIPLIGDLLGKRSRENTRTDLVFFLRPYVLTNSAADNAEAMDRLQRSPQREEVKSALSGTLLTKP